MGEYSVVQEIDLDVFRSDSIPGSELQDPHSGWRRLDWVTDSHIQTQCAEARERIRPIVQDSDDHVVWFDAYGADFIKHESEPVSLFTTRTLTDVIFIPRSRSVSGRIHPDGPPTSLVSNPR